MIKVLLKGGLGNQLWQYSFALYLKTLTSSKLVLQNTLIVPNPKVLDRSFALSKFLQDCSKTELHYSKPINHSSVFGRALFLSGTSKYYEKCITQGLSNLILIEGNEPIFFTPEMLSELEARKSRLFFNGYWQNWKYVVASKEYLISRLSGYLESELIPFFTERKSKLLVIHIRRGDYVTTNKPQNFPTISLTSYLKKINSITDLYRGIDVITVTDDVKSLYESEYYAYFGKILGPEQCTNWQALHIMEKADFLLAANSSLSWWGAFLCKAKGGEVFLPDSWLPSVGIEKMLYPGFSVFGSVWGR